MIYQPNIFFDSPESNPINLEKGIIYECERLVNKISQLKGRKVSSFIAEQIHVFLSSFTLESSSGIIINPEGVKRLYDFIISNILIIGPEAFERAVESSLEGVAPGEDVYFFIPYSKPLSFDSPVTTNSNSYMLKLVREKRNDIRVLGEPQLLFHNGKYPEIRIIDDASYSFTQMISIIEKLYISYEYRGKIKIFLGACIPYSVQKKLTELRRDYPGLRVSVLSQFLIPSLYDLLNESCEAVRSFYYLLYGGIGNMKKEEINIFLKNIGLAQPYFKTPDSFSIDKTGSSFFVQPPYHRYPIIESKFPFLTTSEPQ